MWASVCRQAAGIWHIGLRPDAEDAVDLVVLDRRKPEPVHVHLAPIHVSNQAQSYLDGLVGLAAGDADVRDLQPSGERGDAVPPAVDLRECQLGGPFGRATGRACLDHHAGASVVIAVVRSAGGHPPPRADAVAQRHQVVAAVLRKLRAPAHFQQPGAGPFEHSVVRAGGIIRIFDSQPIRLLRTRPTTSGHGRPSWSLNRSTREDANGRNDTPRSSRTAGRMGTRRADVAHASRTMTRAAHAIALMFPMLPWTRVR